MEIETQEWYIHLIEELKAIIIESSFTARWSLIEGYHTLGQRLLDEFDNFKRHKIYGRQITTLVSESLGKSERTIERAVRFAKKYPDLSLLPEGKNISWHQVCHKYLPELTQTDESDKKTKDDFFEVICPKCHYKFQIKTDSVNIDKKEGR